MGRTRGRKGWPKIVISTTTKKEAMTKGGTWGGLEEEREGQKYLIIIKKAIA